jgi:spermidine/putrescine ABC transporter ATP-binding subunit
MTDDPAVSLSRVTKIFAGHTAVDDVSLEIRRGEFFSLLGPSGCGKTTTLRMISGFEFPTSGRIEIDGKLVNDVPAHRRNTNLVFQQLALFPHLDVFDNIAFGLRLKRVPRREIQKRMTDILEVVGLEGLARRRISQISGGQQQRVAIARALVNEPAVLLLDEPLGALDLKLRMQMQVELKSLQHRVGTTFIYVTHDQSEALVMSDRIAVMNHGRVEQIGSGRDIYRSPKTVFVAAFIGETNLIDGEVQGVDGGVAVVAVEGRTTRAERSGDLQAGQQASISVRPEALRLARPADAPADAMHGVVSDVIFLGSQIRYVVRLPSGRQLKSDVSGDSELFALGDSVVVSWDPASVVALESSAVAAEAAASVEPEASAPAESASTVEVG